jgi:Carboxypeptidase regulatory-like domain
MMAFLAVALVGVTSHAEGNDRRIGDTSWALPGIVRVGVPGAPVPRIGVAATAGYGFTEGQSATDSSHHRAFGSAAFSVTPVRLLEFALRLDGRYDHHTDDGTGSHGGFVGDPRLLARFGAPVGKSFRMGAEVGAWFPGNDAPSLVLGATTVDFGFLGAYAPDGGPTVGLRAGFRLDNSHNAVSEPNRLRFGDRLVLGLSDFNSVPVGIGLAVPVQKTEILAEASGDLLIGSGAPPISESPLRVTAGVRHHVSDAVALLALAEVSPSGRPTVGPNEPLVPIEPRASLILGLTYQLPFQKEAPEAAGPPVETPATVGEKPTPAVGATAAVTVTVHKADGSPASDATVTVRVGEFTKKAEPAADGKFTIDGIPQGEGELEVSAEGAETVKKPMKFSGGAAEPVDVALPQAMPQGEVRGLIRSFNGRGLAASIRVEPIGVETKADAQGSFKIDVPPGDYEVIIKADRFKEQRRKVHVDLNGVTILNAEMFEGKK